MTDERKKLEAAHKAAVKRVEDCWKTFTATQEQQTDAEADLEEKQRWLTAFRGGDVQLQAELLDSTEFSSFDPAAAERETLALLKTIQRLGKELKTAEDELEKAKQSEFQAFYAVQVFDHRGGVIESLKAQIALFHANRKELTARQAVATRIGAEVGPLRHMAFALAQADIRDHHSGVNYRIREAIELGYINGSEDWLTGCHFRTA